MFIITNWDTRVHDYDTMDILFNISFIVKISFPNRDSVGHKIDFYFEIISKLFFFATCRRISKIEIMISSFCNKL